MQLISLTLTAASVTSEEIFKIFYLTLKVKISPATTRPFLGWFGIECLTCNVTLCTLAHKIDYDLVIKNHVPGCQMGACKKSF